MMVYMVQMMINGISESSKSSSSSESSESSESISSSQEKGNIEMQQISYPPRPRMKNSYRNREEWKRDMDKFKLEMDKFGIDMRQQAEEFRREVKKDVRSAPIRCGIGLRNEVHNTSYTFGNKGIDSKIKKLSIGRKPYATPEGVLADKKLEREKPKPGSYIDITSTIETSGTMKKVISLMLLIPVVVILFFIYLSWFTSPDDKIVKIRSKQTVTQESDSTYTSNNDSLYGSSEDKW